MQRDVGASGFGRPLRTIRAAIPDDLDLLPEEKNRRLYRGNAASRARLAADIKKAVDISVDIPEKLGQSADNPLG